MGLLLDAANAWNVLADTSYTFLIGRKRKAQVLTLSFHTADFDHLSGIHYANDVDFGLHRREYSGNRLIKVLLSGKLDDSLITKSRFWEDPIKGRLQAIVHLQVMLDGPFSIYEFHKEDLPFYSDISAAFLLYDKANDNGVFLFLDQNNELFYCKSIFHNETLDYTQNQRAWTVLKKEKSVNGKITLSYIHPHFKES